MKIYWNTNVMNNKITNNLESFRYNVIVANFYEIYNFMIKIINEPLSKEVLKDCYSTILKLMSPFMPHITSECLEEINENIKEITWPIINKKYLLEDKAKIYSNKLEKERFARS